MDRHQLGETIAGKITAAAPKLAEQWSAAAPVRHFYIDDLLPAEPLLSLPGKFPTPSQLLLRSSLREHKRAGVDVAAYDPAISEHLFAFQQPAVIAAIAKVTGLQELEADPTLYASGVSVMYKDDFLNPHIDNSHDGDGLRYRILNLLFYVAPDWKLENGGNLELWDSGITSAKTIVSKFNRLVVMETNQTSWHSVSKVVAEGARLCISNYFFSRQPTTSQAYLHVTTFAGRPEERFKRLALKLDGLARNALGKAFPVLLRRTKHRIKPAPEI
jgi:Rps23 Pro-64 3,4-dihydroxylase Tpa1-like proline 4-hydroxylase